MSIKTKVILAMATLTVLIVGVLFIMANTVTSSNISNTINLSGITYTKAVQAAGKQYAAQINESGMLSVLQREVQSDPGGEVGKYWTQGLLNTYQVSPHFLLAHQDGGYPSIDAMVDDLQWVRAAGIVELLINPEDKSGEERDLLMQREGALVSAAAEMLGKDWLDYRDDLTPPVRSILNVPSAESAQFFPKEADLPEGRQKLSFERLQQYIGAEKDAVGQETTSRLRNLFRALAKKVRSDGRARLLGMSELSYDDPQVIGVRYEPRGIDLGFTSKITGKKSSPTLTADEFLLDTYEKQVKLSSPAESGEAGISVQTGEDTESNRELRIYTTTATEDGRALVYLDPIALDKARSETLLWIGLVTALSLTIAVVSAFILGGGITKPVTALMKDVSTIAAGNFQHRPKIRSRDEIGALGTLIGEMAASLEIGQSAWRENKSRQHDIDMAREIQENLLPKDVPEIKGYDISAFYSPSKEVGGDYYDFFQVDKEHLGIICADVSGKGIPGSMVMMMTKALITYVAKGNTSPKDVFCKVNQIIAKDIKRGMFVTAYYAVLNLKTRSMQIVSAGHNPMVLYRGKTKTCEEVNPGGIALGFDKDGKLFERNMKEETLQLGRGDRVVIYTDGIIEAVEPGGTPYGIESLKEFTTEMGQAASPDYLQNLVSDIDAFTQSDEQGDDITVVSLRIE